MYTLLEEPAGLRELNERSQELLQNIRDELALEPSLQVVHANSEMFDDAAHEGMLYILREGDLQYFRDGRVLFYFEEGDLIGFEQTFGGQGGTICTDFAVKLDEYDAEEFIVQVGSKLSTALLWNQYLATQQNLLCALAASVLQEDMKFNPRVVHFEAGDTIIEQGGEGKEVYTLAEGHAEVFVGGVQVGEIHSDEIFGAIAALTKTPRTATVIARDPCLVLALPRERFIDLIKNRPGTVHKLVDDMARKMVALNERVVNLSS